MAQRVVTSSLNTVTPGAYPEVNVKSTPVGIASGGAILIIGEADGGESYSEVDLKDNFFSPDQADEVEAQYVRGNIVDAMQSLAAPANDTNIQGSVSRVYIAKTNTSAKASAIMATSYATLSASKSGKDGNKISYNVSESQAEIAPVITSGTVPAFGAALDGAVVNIRLDGGASASVTLGVGGHADIAALIIEIDGLLPAGIGVSAGTGDVFVLTVDVDASAHQKGYGKSVEISGDLADLNALGLSAGQTNSSAESEIEVNIVRQDINIDETLEVVSPIALEIGYEGTSAALVSSATGIAVTVVGGSGANLAVNYSDFKTIKELVDFINSQDGYTASNPSTVSQKQSSSLDQVSIDIASSNSGAKPGRIKKNASDANAIISTSVAVSIVSTAVKGLPDATASKIFLAGGDKGATTGNDVVKALVEAEGISVNFIVPLISRDASDDISDSLTESASTYTIDAVHAACKDHTLKMSTIKLKRNRISILSFKGSFADVKGKAGSLASFRIPMTFQDIDRLSNGVIKTFQPWMASCVAAGMQSAGFYKAIVKKFANITTFRDPSDFDSGKPGDVEEALEAGLLFLESDTAGSKWVSDQTTYGLDTNFVYNSLQAVYLSDRLAIDLSDSVENRFVGKSLADIDVGSVKAFIHGKMEIYKNIKMIASSDDAVLGFKNLKIKIKGPVLEISIEVKLATAIYFIPLTINISQVELSA